MSSVVGSQNFKQNHNSNFYKLIMDETVQAARDHTNDIWKEMFALFQLTLG